MDQYWIREFLTYRVDMIDQRLVQMSGKNMKNETLYVAN